MKLNEIKDPIDIYPQFCLDEDFYNRIKIENIKINEKELEQWLNCNKHVTNYTRLLRYFLSSYLIKLDKMDNVLDVGSGDDTYALLIKDSVHNVILNDVVFNKYRSTENVYIIKENVFDFNFEKYRINKIVVGHAFEHMKFDDDKKLIELICSKLPEGGKCCIEPIFLGRKYLEVFNYNENEQYDFLAKKIITRQSNFPGKKEHNMGFARIYSETSFYERVLKIIEEKGLKYRLISFSINDKYLPDMDKYVFKRTSINYPLRMLLIEK